MGTSVNANGIAGEVQDLALPASTTIVQTAPVGHTQSTSGAVTATFSSPPTAGNLLIAVCVGAGNGVADGWTGTPRNWVWDAGSTGVQDIAIGHAFSDGTTEAFTFTETNPDGSTCDRWVILMEVPGVNAVDHVVTTANVTTPWAAALAANYMAVEFELFAIILEGSAITGTPTASNSFAVTSESGSATVPVSLILATKSVTSQDTPSSSIAWVGSGNTYGCGVSYRWLPPVAPQTVASPTIQTSLARH